VRLLADTPSLLIVKLALPVKTPRDLVDYAHANAGKLNYGSPGSGSLNRLEMELGFLPSANRRIDGIERSIIQETSGRWL